MLPDVEALLQKHSDDRSLGLTCLLVTYSQWCCGRDAGAPGDCWTKESKRAGCGTVASLAGWRHWTHSWELLYHSAGCSSASQKPGEHSCQRSFWKKTTTKILSGNNQLWDNACAVYLLWDVIDTVPIQEKLHEAGWYTSRHPPQRVMSQVELHQVRKALKAVLTQATVTQLTEKTSHICSTNARDLVRLHTCLDSTVL